MERETFTVQEIAQKLGLGKSLTYLAVRRGDIPSIKIGGRILIPRASFEQWLKDTTHQGAPPCAE